MSRDSEMGRGGGYAGLRRGAPVKAGPREDGVGALRQVGACESHTADDLTPGTECRLLARTG